MGPRAVRRLEQRSRARAVQAALKEASDPLTPPERMVALTQSWPDHATVRETLARNPSVPPQALALLLPDVPFAVARNPVLPLAPLEDPEFLNRPSPLALRRLLMDPQVPLALLELLQFHIDPAVAAAARDHVGLAGEAVEVGEIDAWIDALPTGDPALLGELLRLGAIGDKARWLPRAGAANPLPPTRAERRERTPVLLAQAKAQECTLVRFLAHRSPWTDPAPASRGLGPDERLASVLNPRATRRLLEPRTQDSHRLVRAAARQRLGSPLS